MRSSKFLVPALVFAASVAYDAPALAGQTIYPASMCVPWDGTVPVPALSGSRIYNNSATQWMYVDCPILHQDFGSLFTDDDLNDADIGIIDAHTLSDASCWLRSVYQSGSNFYAYSGGTRSTVGFGSQEQNLDFDLVNGNSETWYYIGCQVPPRQNGQSSGITYYRGEE